MRPKRYEIRMDVRVTRRDFDSFVDAAERMNLPLSDWVRMTLRKARRYQYRTNPFPIDRSDLAQYIEGASDSP